MAYIGNIPADKYTSFAKQDFTVTATTSYTLDHSVSNEFEIALFINFVRQEPTTAYTATGTSLTLTEATSVGDDMYCVFIGKAVQTVTPADNTISTNMLKDNAVTDAKINASLGKVGQVVSKTKLDSFTSQAHAANTGVDITGLNVSITPSATSSKILLMYNVNGAMSTGGRQPNFGIRLLRGSTAISLANEAGNRGRVTATNCFNTNDDDNASTNVAGTFLDSPSTTSATTYKIQLYNIASTSRTMNVNMTHGDADDSNFRPRSTSTITAIEVLA